MPGVCENVVKDGVLGGGVRFSEKLDLNKMIEEDNFDPLYGMFISLMFLFALRPFN
ncbi:hypothetical protein Hanom_Chr16g01475661 [Helianthus anomalus]